jgi:lipopolysaccharide transport system permease protein
MALFLGFLLITGNWPGWAVLGAVPVLLVQVAFSIGLGITLGVLNVFFRDVGQFFGIALTFWFWLTPIVYPASILPENARGFLLGWNPMAPVMAAYQSIFVSGTWPDWPSLLMPIIVAAAFCLLGLRLFRKRAGEMVDEL